MADAHLNFDTKINTSGFKAGTAEIKKSLTSLSRGLGSMKTSMENAFSGNQRSVSAFQSKAKTLEKTISDLQADLQKLGSIKIESEDFKYYTKELEKAELQLDRLYQKRNKQEALGVGEFSKSWENLSYDIEQAEIKVNEAKATIEAAKNTGANFQLGVDTEKYAQLSQRLEQAKEEYARLIEAGQEFNSVARETPTFSFSGLKEAMSEASTVSEYFERLNKRVNQAIANGLLGVYKKISGAFASIKERLSGLPELGSRIAEGFKHPIQSIGSVMESVAGKVNQGLGSIGAGAKYVGSALASSFGSAALSGLKKIGELALSAGKALTKAFGVGVKAAIIGIGNAIKSVATKIKTALGNAIKNAVKSFASLRKSASSTEKGLGGLVKKLGSVSSMLKRMLLRRALSSIINGAKEGIENLAQASPAFNAAMSSLKGSLTGMKNAFASAFGSILPIVLPVLQTLIGWLTTAANYIAQFFSALSGKKTFSKAVAVQEDYAASLGDTAKAAKEAKNELLGFDKITKLQDDSSSGSGGGGGVSPADMFEETAIDSSISEFVQALKDAWAAEDFTAVGEIIGNKLNEMVNKVDEMVSWDNVGDKITTWITNLGEVFNSFMDTVDWENIGKTIADGLNTITYTIETFIDEFDLDKIGTALSDIFNGFNVNYDWESLGETIGKGLNEITSAVNNFADGTDWKSFGTNIASALNSMVNEVDGEALGKALSAKLKIGLEAANGFVHEFKWADLGSKLSDVVEGWFGNINWEELGDTIATGLNGIADTVTTFVNDTNWNDIGDKVGSAFSTLADNIDGEKIGSALGAPLEALNQTISGFLENFEKNDTWKDAGKKIGDAINGWFSSIDWSTVGSNISGSISGLFDTLASALESLNWGDLALKTKELLQGINWTDVVKSIFTALANGLAGLTEYIGTLIGEAFLAADNYFKPFIDEAGGNVIQGLWNGIKAAFGNVWQWIKDNIFQPFIDAFKRLFGINSPSTVMAELGGYLIDGLKNGLSGIWDKVKEKFSEWWEAVKNWFTERFENFKNLGTKVIENLKSGIGNIWATIKEKFSDFWTSVLTWFQEKYENFKNLGTKVIDNLKSGIGNIWGNIKEKFSSFWTGVKEWFSGKFDSFKSYGAKFISSLKSGVGNIWNAIKEKFSAFWSKVTEWFKGKWDKFRNFGATITSKIKEGLGNIWEKVKEKFTNLWNNIKSFWSGKKLVESTVTVKTHTSSSGAEHGGGGGEFAKGGIITHKITGATLGEAGPEAVIPLKNNTEWLDIVGKYVTNHLPQLATGTVVPANFGKFFAILGDNKREPEIVSPESTMKKAVLDALRESGLVGSGEAQTINLTLNLDGKAIYNDVVRINRQRTRMGGVNPLGV